MAGIEGPARKVAADMTRRLFKARASAPDAATITLTREQIETLCAGAFQAGVNTALAAIGREDLEG